MDDGKKPRGGEAAEGLAASVQLLPLPIGLYLFSVKAAAPSVAAGTGGISLPAIHVSLGPGVRADQVEFVSGPGTNGTWLFAHGDMLVARVTGTGATLVLASIRAPGGETLSVAVERLEGRTDASSTGNVAAPEPAPAPTSDPNVVPLQVSAHIRARGDRKFANVAWAGRAGTGLWIESFSVQPMDGLHARDIEYKGLTGNGFETPWISDDLMCGTKGMAVPLIGFAVRLRPGPDTADFDCEYSGFFQSGATRGPFRNGAPCRSTVANDPLEGIQIRIVRRTVAPAQTLGTSPARSPLPPLTLPAARKPQPASRAPGKTSPVAGKSVKAAPSRKPAKATRTAGAAAGKAAKPAAKSARKR